MTSRGRANVAIDGPVGSGKTTVARALARRLDLLYLDTGAMYRAVALIVRAAGVAPSDGEAVAALVRAHPLHVRLDEDAAHGFHIVADGREFGRELYGNEVSPIAAAVAAHVAVRTELTRRQREIAAAGSVVMAGRDIGTVVLPDAPHKIFLTASVDARVRRRAAELARDGVAIDPAELREQIVARDRSDETRPVAPLRTAPGAVVVDSSDLTIEDVVARIAALVEASTAA